MLIKKINFFLSFLFFFATTLFILPLSLESSLQEYEFKIPLNGNIYSSMIKSRFEKNEINQIVQLINLQCDLKSLKVSDIFKIIYYEKSDHKHITKFSFKCKLNNKNLLVSYNSDDRKYEIQTTEARSEIRRNVKNIDIKTSLFADGIASNLSPTIIQKIIDEYSFIVDFQRDIKVNDKLKIIFDTTVDLDTNQVIGEKILYINLILSGKQNPIFEFENEFFNRKGDSVAKSLLKTPIDGARISSKFNLNRKHPILGYTKAHKGVDFAAKAGTPIYASGSGYVSFIGWEKNGCGKMIELTHGSNYKTRYCHMSKFGRNIKIKTNVYQKQIIGHVGTTGLSTGAHLHYEVIYAGKHINPQKIKIASNKKIPKENKSSFITRIQEINKILYENT